uniref:Reverse transcriptase n=1 Tax=Quercus lobata TaxID=97700 RepID=A0A7N2MW51_QUELO
MGPYKGPGPDGIPGFFFQQFWDIVKMDVCDAIQAFFHSGSLLKALNQTFITLIPKIPNPKENAFTKGRNITDNILLAHEIIDVVRKKRGKRDSFGVLKISMSKAYDRVN